jgi:hypothetical protein
MLLTNSLFGIIYAYWDFTQGANEWAPVITALWWHLLRPCCVFVPDLTGHPLFRELLGPVWQRHDFRHDFHPLPNRAKNSHASNISRPEKNVSFWRAVPGQDGAFERARAKGDCGSQKKYVAAQRGCPKISQLSNRYRGPCCHQSLWNQAENLDAHLDLRSMESARFLE